MNKNAFVGALVAAVVALGVLAVRQSREIASLQDAQAQERAALEKQVAVLKSAREEVRAKAARGAQKAAAANDRQAPATTAQAEPAAIEVAAAATQAGTNFMGAIAGMMKNPQMKEMIRAQQKVMVSQMYGALPRYLNLSAETKEQLDKLLLDRQMAMAEVGLTMMNGSEEERKQALEDSKTVKETYDRAIQDLLGDQDDEIFKQYEQSVSEQTTVSMFKNTLTGEDSLSEQQEYDLVTAMYQARKEMPQDSVFNKENQSADPSQFTEERIAETLKQMEDLQKRYAESATAVLTEPQLARFKQWQEQMAVMQQTGLKVSAQMFGQGKSGAAAEQK